jgi:hypothetical protein
VQVHELSKNLQGLGHLRNTILRLRKGVTLNLPIGSASARSIWSNLRSVSCLSLQVLYAVTHRSSLFSMLSKYATSFKK